MKKSVLKIMALLMSFLMLLGMVIVPISAEETDNSTAIAANQLLKSYGFTIYNNGNNKLVADNEDGSNPAVVDAKVVDDETNGYLQIEINKDGGVSYPYFELPVPTDMTDYTIEVDVIDLDSEGSKKTWIAYATNSNNKNGTFGFKTIKADTLYFSEIVTNADSFALSNTGKGVTHNFVITVEVDAETKAYTDVSLNLDGSEVTNKTYSTYTHKSSRVGLAPWKGTGANMVVGYDNIKVVNNTTGEVVYYEDFEEDVVKYDDITAYRTADGNVAPSCANTRVFAGWYADEACTTAIAADATSGYAKFVPTDVLSVKAQVSKDVTAEDTTTGLRLITTVDSLDYKEVGFILSVDNGVTETKQAITTVYTTITAMGDDYKPTSFAKESAYFATFSITDVPTSNTTITVTPYWVTADGTTVLGDSVNAVMADLVAAQLAA